MSLSAEIAESHPGAVFLDDSETFLWRFTQREEHNLVYQSRLDPLPEIATIYCPDHRWWNSTRQSSQDE
jgi:hypothetical protein